MAQVREIDLFVGPFVAGRNNADHVVFHEGLDLDVTAHRRSLDERELDAVFDKSLKHGLGVASSDGDFDSRMIFQEAGDEAWQKVLADGLRGGDGEAAGGFSGGCGDGLASFFGESGEFIGIGKQGFAGKGERNPASAAVKEGDREFGFEGLDLLSDGGLGEQEFFGRLAEVQVPGDGAEDAEAEIFHSDQSTESFYPPPKSLAKKWPMPWKNPPCFFAGGFGAGAAAVVVGGASGVIFAGGVGGGASLL